MRIWWLAILASAGCGFTSPGEGGGGPGMDPGPGGDRPDGSQTTVRTVCDRSDPSLRLCVDFAGTVVDSSAIGASIAVTDVSAMDRDGDPAAALSTTSTMHVHEATALDIQGALALDMWIRPSGKPLAGTSYWMLDNNQQYGIEYTDLGTIRCVLSNRVVDSAVLPVDGRFHHVACTYDRTKLKVFIDGDVSRCADQTIEIPITGIDGLAIGANLSGTDLVPLFNEVFVGGLDDVRVWARADLDVCAAAGRTGCLTNCSGL
jgi:hypothetical protein